MAISSKSDEQDPKTTSKSNLEKKKESDKKVETNEIEKIEDSKTSEKTKKKAKSSKKDNTTASIDLAPYQVQEILVKDSSKIKDEMELLEKRLEKMYEHKENVSDDVFLKVKSDYETQLDKVRESFEEKCQELEEELEKLYELKEEQQGYLSRHESILEEAKFRHMLEEYSDEDFKNEQKVQNKEIKKYNTILETIKSSIQKYEDILGRPYTPKDQSTEEEKIEEFKEDKESLSAEELLNLNESSEKSTEEAKEKISPRLEETPPMGISEAEIAEQIIAKSDKPKETPNQTIEEEYDDFLEIEGDYFSEKEASAKSLNQENGPEKAPEVAQDDSISHILKDIPFEESSEEVLPPVDEPTGELAAAKASPSQEGSEASLLLIEGTLDEHEYILGETTTMGRSPSNDVVLKESRISRQHANISKTDEGYVIVDLKSSNGILVNDQKVEEALLQDGDEIQVGGFRFQFNIL